MKSLYKGSLKTSNHHSLKTREIVQIANIHTSLAI